MNLITAEPGTWRTLLQHGDQGADVAYVQARLVALGADLSGDDAGVFGRGTHNATLSIQRLHGLERDGLVGPKTVAALIEAGRLPPLPHEPALPELVPISAGGWEALPFVQARHYRAVTSPARAHNVLVIHCMEAPEQSTRAERCADNFAHGIRVASAHVCVDDDSIVRCVRLEDVAFGAPGANRDGDHLELAGYARQTRAQWLDAFGVAMLRNAARVIELWSHLHDIPLRFIPATALRAGGATARGVTTHHEVSRAFGQSTHHDPGKEFPMDWFLDRAREVRAARAAPA